MKLLLLGPSTDQKFHYGVSYAFNKIKEGLSSEVGIDLIELESSEKSLDEPTKKQSRKEPGGRVVQEKAVVSKTQFNPYSYLQDSSSVSLYSSEFKDEYQNFITDEIKRFGNDVIDLVYVHDWVYAELAMHLKKSRNIPFVYHVHSLEIDRSSKRGDSFINKVEERAMQEADLIVAVSRYHADIMHQVYEIPTTKIKVIHLAVDQHEVDKHDSQRLFKEPTILFSGRLAHQKNVNSLVTIFNKLHGQKSNIRLVIAGDGPLFDELVMAVSRHHLLDKVHFCGKLEHSEMLELYKQVDLLVSTSFSEPFGLSILEAAYQGLPIICSSTTGVTEVIKSAISIDYSNTDKYVMSLKKLLFNLDYYKRLSHAVQQEARKRTWGQVQNEIKETLLSAQ